MGEMRIVSDAHLEAVAAENRQFVSDVGRPFRADPMTVKELSARKGRPTAPWESMNLKRPKPAQSHGIRG